MHERHLELRAASDLMITRIRQLLSLPFIGSDNTPPGLINDAFLHGHSKALSICFSQSPRNDSAYRHAAGQMHVQLHPLDSTIWEPPNPTMWDRFRQSMDEAALEFQSIAFPTEHVRRLIFQFAFGDSRPVNRDIRTAHLAPLLSPFAGKLTYVAPEDYSFLPGPVEWEPHPTGILPAWEGEYTFAHPVPVTELRRIFQDAYNVRLWLDWPTRLPAVEIDGIHCRFSVTTRFF